jgi:hypothetical protein
VGEDHKTQRVCVCVCVCVCVYIYIYIYIFIYEGDTKVSGLAARSENCKWYSSLPVGAVVSLFYESV